MLGLLYNKHIMEQGSYKSAELDAIFGALADPTRRAILARLSDGSATVGELSAPFKITQPAVSRHLKVLEAAGLIKRASERQTRPAQLNAKPLFEAARWLEDFRDHWTDRLDHLDLLLSELKTKETE